MGIMKDKCKKRDESTCFCESPPFPDSMMLESTNACNLRCSFCSVKGRVNSYAKPDLIKKILRDAYTGGTREVCFNLNGEPLLHPDIANFVQMAKECGYTYIYNTTNGVLAKRELVQKMADNGLHSLKFSINASNAEHYRKIHGADKFESVLQNLRDAAKIRDASKRIGGSFYRLMVTFVYYEEITEEMRQFKNSLEPILDDFDFIKVHIGRRRMKPKCAVPFHRLYVSAEGYLSLCFEDFDDELVIADLNEMNILDAWNCDLAREHRRKLLEQKHLNGTLCGWCIGVCEKPIKPISDISLRHRGK